MTERRLYIVFGFRGAMLRDTLALTPTKAKRLCVQSLRENHPDYEREGVRWRDIAKWGWRCVPITVSWEARRR